MLHRSELPGRAATASPSEDEAIENVIHARIQKTVLSGLLPPGTKLPEEELADTFGVSRARIRAVLQRLAWEQLVELVRNRGAFIRRPSIKEARDVFEARRVIERVTTEIAARTIITPNLAMLRRCVVEQARLLSEGDRQRAILEAGEFHRRLSALAHNQPLTRALEPLILRTSLIVAVYGRPQATLRAASHHEAILSFIERGESLLASRAMERCLYAIEAELDLTGISLAPIDLRRTLSVVG